MSIAVLNQVYDEARRLAVAGSVVAKGDFRLKKLVGPLEQARAKAPVFAKVAESAAKVIDGPEDTSAESLLELTSLVTAVLYTQGETGIAGELQPIETVNLGGETAQTSARLLKPLLEALDSTGSGRLELVKDAHERGAFRDLRLIKPALNGLDDPYADVADFLAENVLPMYGKAILPELRRAYDPKGTRGHPRRLKLMHALDPAGTRELVKQALEGGSKEVKVAAIACLGAEAEDLQYLTEQASAKVQEVRRAAYQALARVNAPAATAVLERALAGKDLEGVSGAIHLSRNGRLTPLLVSEIKNGLAQLFQAKDKKQVSGTAARLVQLVRSLPDDEHPDASDLIIDLFRRRAELAKAKGETHSGSDVAEAVIARMGEGSTALQVALARAHAELDAQSLAAAFWAARRTMPAADVFTSFSPYLTVKSDAKKSGPNVAKRDAIIASMGGGGVYWWHRHTRDDDPSLDPRWLDVAVQLGHLGLIHAVGRPGHAAAEKFLRSEFDAAFKKAKSEDYLDELVQVMVRLGHPDATDALIAVYSKSIGKITRNFQPYYHLIPDLPKAALPKLEAIVPRLKGPEEDRFVDAIQELRNKKE